MAPFIDIDLIVCVSLATIVILSIIVIIMINM